MRAARSLGPVPRRVWRLPVRRRWIPVAATTVLLAGALTLVIPLAVANTASEVLAQASPATASSIAGGGTPAASPSGSAGSSDGPVLMLSDKYAGGGTGLSYARFTQTGGSTFSFTAPRKVGTWKVYVYAYDGHGNVGIETRSFTVVPPAVDGTDLANRIYDTARATGYRSSLYEFGVNG